MKEERSSDKMRRIVVRFRSCFNMEGIEFVSLRPKLQRGLSIPD